MRHCRSHFAKHPPEEMPQGEGNGYSQETLPVLVQCEARGIEVHIAGAFDGCGTGVLSLTVGHSGAARKRSS